MCRFRRANFCSFVFCFSSSSLLGPYIRVRAWASVPNKARNNWKRLEKFKRVHRVRSLSCMLHWMHETMRGKKNLIVAFQRKREEIESDRSSVKAFSFTSQKFSGWQKILFVQHLTTLWWCCILRHLLYLLWKAFTFQFRFLTPSFFFFTATVDLESVLKA